MPTRQEIIDALRPVEDPELRQSIVDLGMVKDVDVAGGAVRVTVALTVAGCPLRAEITNRVTAAVTPLSGVSSVDVELTVMSDEERAALRGRLQGAGHDHGGQGAHAGHSHGPSQS